MSISRDDALLIVLRDLSGEKVEYRTTPRPLTGGAFSDMFVFEVDRPIAGYAGRLVLRLLPWPEQQIRTEAALQDGAHAAGLPAPRVMHLEVSDRPLGTPFMIMEFLTGRPFLGGVTWYQFARDFPRMVTSWPDMFTRTLDALAQADATAATASLDRYGVSAEAANTTRHLRWVEANLPENSGYDDAVGWLNDRCPPSPHRNRIVHGDLWPSNVFTHRKQLTGLVDWTTGAIGDPALDVGFAKVGLALMPEPFPPPPPIRNVVHAIGVRLAGEVHQRTAASVGGDERVAYYEALRCMVQITLAHYPRGQTAWQRAVPALVEHLNTVTGLQLRAD